MPDCITINPLQRSGTSQYRRVLQALLPAYARVDERDYADLVLFAKQYAAYLTYFDAGNKAAGDWSALMKMDISVSLATMAKHDAGAWFTYIQELYKQLQDTNNPASLQQYYTSIYHFIATLIYQLDEQLQLLPKDFAFTEYLNITIASRMNDAWFKLKAWYTESGKPANAMIDDTAPLSPPETPIQVQRISELLVNNLSNAWTPLAYVPPIHGTTPAERIRNTVNHNIFKGLVESLLKAYSAIISTAGQYLEATLTDFPTHTPHYALYLTFLKLFRVAQDHINTFTNRHLQFYYREVLRLKLKNAEADQAHLVFELQKNIPQYLLKKDTLFKGGKNPAGQELFYSLTDDILLNKGKVKTLRSLLALKPGITTTVYAAPVSNSADGKGAPLTSADKSWKPFGDAATNDTASFGMAIAHPMLFLQEGTRNVYITFHLSHNYGGSPIDVHQHFTLLVTGPKGWYAPYLGDAIISGNELVIEFQLGPGEPALVAYKEEIHKEGYNHTLPMAKLLLKNEKGQPNYYDELKVAHVTSVHIEVGVIGMKNVSLQNELGPLDAAKSFQLFGPVPHMDSAFTIGSKEIFLKNHYGPVEADLLLEWDGTDQLDTSLSGNNYEYFTAKKIAVQYLKDGEWIENGGTQALLAHTHTAYNGITLHTPPFQHLDLHLPAFHSGVDLGANEPYSLAAANGYMRVVFRGPTDFGHSTYAKRMTAAAINNSASAVPDQPYTPAVKSFALGYDASAEIDLSLSAANDFVARQGYYFHLTPFGHAAQHRSILGSTAAITLLPVFPNEGELFIGIENLKAGQSLHLLFRISDGSADPAYDRQPLQWQYLTAHNLWMPFDQYSVTDGTNDLTKTGIIRFAFPETAVTANTLMGEHLHWIRCIAPQHTPAICNLVNIHAQAATVVLTDHMNTGVEYTGFLAAGTISKLLISDAAIKTTLQPYDSFGGRIKEPDPQFYTRVSERLRHKNRAITMWDYERMVLQQFPEIYKVKCINHTKINTAGNGDNELLPGYVLVVPIPDLTGKNAINPLRPQTSIGTLEEIKKYLHRHISPFVKLQVKNARFEEIQLDFKVKFLTDDGAYYSNLLMNEIEQYLSPWAFGGKQDIEFGGKISKSKLLNFVEERSYVDYLTCFKMYHIVDGIKSGNVEEAVATSSRSVFVSYAGNPAASDPRHRIDYTNPDCNC